MLAKALCQKWTPDTANSTGEAQWLKQLFENWCQSQG